MRKITPLLFLIISISSLNAQFAKHKAIDFSIGYGLSAPYDDFDITGEGFYFEGEYAITIKNWLDIRPYAGLILANTPNGDDAPLGPDYRSDAEAALVGIKSRLRAPIPWVAPYLEIGLGASIGTLVTFTPFTDLRESGLLYHIPFSIGLELGPKHNFDIAFIYYFHPSVEQFSGAAAIGISIPIR